MGNSTSCCVSSSPKLRRNAHSRLEPYRPEPELSREDTGCNLQHISDRENIDGGCVAPASVRTLGIRADLLIDFCSRVSVCGITGQGSRELESAKKYSVVMLIGRGAVVLPP